MNRKTRITLTFCAGITCAAILLAHGAGYPGAIWAVWGLTMGCVAGWSIRINSNGKEPTNG